MKIAYLAFSEEKRDRLLAETLPDSVCREWKKTFRVGGRESFLIEFCTKGTGVAMAKALGAVRDRLPSAKGVHILEDDASQLFAKRLFPSLAEYERELRRTLFLALDLGETDETDGNELLKIIERESLSRLGNKLFTDDRFVKAVKERAGERRPFSKEEITRLVESTEEKAPWDILFGGFDMGCVKRNFWPIVECRNAVMHHRTIKGDEYDNALHRLRNSTNALLAYSSRVCEEKGSSKDRERRAERASWSMMEGIRTEKLSESLAVISEIVLRNNESLSGLAAAYSEAARALADQYAGISKTASETLAATSAMKQIQDSASKVVADAFKPLGDIEMPSLQTTPPYLTDPLPNSPIGRADDEENDGTDEGGDQITTKTVTL